MQSDKIPIISGSSEARKVLLHCCNLNHEGRLECEFGFLAYCDRKGMHEERTFS